MNDSIESVLSLQKQYIERTHKLLQLLNPKTILTRGYAILTKDGKSVSSITKLNIGDNLNAILSDGEIIIEVK